jgi:hypothetical protein
MAQKKSGTGAGTLIGLSALAAAGIAAGYFLLGKDGAKNRKKIKSWTLKAKGEVLEKIEKWKNDFNESDYKGLIDMVADKYRKIKDMDPAEVESFAKELKSHWKDIKKTTSSSKGSKKK